MTPSNLRAPMVYADRIDTMSDVSASPSCPPSGRALYVYYRVQAGQEAAARAVIDTMQATLKPFQPGLRARLMGRVEAAAESTWMEVYEHPDGVSPACEAMLDHLASALPDGLFGPRHVEVFSPVGAP
jgi:hypothetical protein